MKIVSKRGKEKNLSLLNAQVSKAYTGGYTQEQVDELNRHAHQEREEDIHVELIFEKLNESLQFFPLDLHDWILRSKIKFIFHDILQGERAVSDFKVICDASNNPPDTNGSQTNIVVGVRAFNREFYKEWNLK